ncbi:DUF4214 domain-containing protein [Christensenellaceae bacterium OttesenSCG-928-K19]|nr:DUF4214 domain-containing protein [Christensenellaceae bacterium OttesenSCG-928-K19]
MMKQPTRIVSVILALLFISCTPVLTSAVETTETTTPTESASDADVTHGDNSATQPEPSVPIESNPAPMESAVPTPEVEPSSEPDDNPVTAQSGLLTPVETILQIAQTDGKTAAELLNEYEDRTLFEDGVKQILTLYYEKNLQSQLALFTETVKDWANDLLGSFVTAAGERQLDETELGYVPGEVIVIFKENISETTAAQTIEESAAIYIEEIASPIDENIGLVEIPVDQTVADAIEELEKNPAIEYVQPNYLYVQEKALEEDVYVAGESTVAQALPNDYYTNLSSSGTKQWNFEASAVSGAWDVLADISNNKIRVAVLDTGVDIYHEDLQKNLNKNLCVDATVESLPRITTDGKNQNDSTNGSYGDFHGTHVAGIIGATANNNIGIAGLASGSNNHLIELFVVDVFRGKYAYSSDISRGINHALNNNAKVINLSLGGVVDNNTVYAPNTEDYLLQQAIQTASAQDAAVVAAAGNVDGVFATSAPFRCTPADSPYCIAVIATTQNGTRWGGSNFSTGSNYYYGNASDSDAKRYFSAPGDNIISTKPATYTYYQGRYLYANGTSMATPAISSVIAMMYYLHPDLTVSQIKTILQQTSANASNYTLYTGWGSVNAAAAISTTYGLLGNKLASPSITKLTQPDNLCIRIQWSPVSNSTGYQIYRSTSRNSGYSAIASVSGTGTTSYNDTKVNIGQTYYYKIKARHKNSLLSSSLSVAATVTTRFFPYANTIEGFVQRMYELSLSRKPDASGYNNWVSAIRNGLYTGPATAYGFASSPEFISLHRTNSEFIESMYMLLLNRIPDTMGKASWVRLLDVGMSREYVIGSMSNSAEFQNLCRNTGIRWEYSSPSQPRDQNYDITAFVNRLYNECLGRTPDTNGLNDWCQLLLNGYSGADTAYGFFTSAEFLYMNTTNAEYVEILYRTMLGRDSDTIGKQSWIRLLNQGYSRRYVFTGFVYSAEFTQLCNEHGIVRGNPSVEEV